MKPVRKGNDSNSVLRRAILASMPPLSALSIWISPRPGAADQAFAYRLLVIVLAVPVALLVLPSRRFSRLERGFLAFAGVTVAWGFLSLRMADDPALAWRQVIATVLALVGAAILVALAETQQEITAVRFGMIGALTAIVLMGVIEWRTGVPWEVRAGRPWIFGNALGGPFINPNNYASFLLALSPPVLILLKFPNTTKNRVILSGLLLGAAWTGLQADSRTTWYFGSMMLAVAMLWRSRSSQGGLPAWILLALALPAAYATGVAGFVSRAFSSAFGGTDNAESDALRVALAKSALRFVEESRGIGIGAGNFLSRLEMDSSRGFSRVTNAHNTFLQIAAEYGLLVFTLLALLIAAIALAAAKSRGVFAEEVARTVSRLRLEIILVLLGVVAGGLSASSLLADSTWWLLIGYCVILARRLEDVAHQDSQAVERTNGLESDRPDSVKARNGPSERSAAARYPSKQRVREPRTRM